MSGEGPLGRIRARLRRPSEIARAAAAPASGGRSPELSEPPGSQPELAQPPGRSPEPPEPAGGRPPGPAPEADDFEHAPDATPDEVPAPRKIGFDGRELPERGPQSGHSPGMGGMGGGY